MGLFEALQTYISDEDGLGWSHAFFVGEIDDPNVRECNLVLFSGNDRDDPTKLHRHPVIQLFIRRETEASARADIEAAYQALNRVGRMTLTPTYRCHSACPLGPVALGKDGRQLWRATVDIYFSIPYSAAL